MVEHPLLSAPRIWISVFIVIMASFLTACSTVAGDVVPKTGPKMEQVYDSMQHTKTTHAEDEDNEQSSAQIQAIRDHLRTQKVAYRTSPNFESTRNLNGQFHRISNPELKMYVYPHFVGRDQSPVPGYETVFNAYEQNYYALAGQGQE